MFLVCCKVSGLIFKESSPCLDSCTKILIFSGIRKYLMYKINPREITVLFLFFILKRKGQVRIEVPLVPFSVIFLQVLVWSVLSHPSASVTCQFLFSGELLIGFDVLINSNGHLFLCLHSHIIFIFIFFRCKGKQ